MKSLIILLLLLCNCYYTSWYITEVGKENNDECKEIIREKEYYKNLQFKKVRYRIKKECRKDFKRNKKERKNLWN